MQSQRYEWKILQEGVLALRPDGQWDEVSGHYSSCALLWPAGQSPQRGNTLISDPCLLSDRHEEIMAELQAIGYSLYNIGVYHVTHTHFDHQPCLGEASRLLAGKPYQLGQFDEQLPGLRLQLCPGHDPLQQALVFTDTEDQEVWIAGDAILDIDWLLAWKYYWPNGYSPEEIVQTWRTVAKILASAEVVIPGHGPVINVTADLLQTLVNGFDSAEHADRCPDVKETLQARLDKLNEA
jgi:glyoxylase-like metal-dependent hydrolase (beta-lactamase superfamily II)